MSPALGNVNDALAKAGMHITVAGPVQMGNNVAGQLTSDGLRIDFELSDRTFPALKQLLDLVPAVPSAPGAPSLADIITVAEARHLVAFEIGRGSVSLVARPTHAAHITPALASSSVGSSIAAAGPPAPASQRNAAASVGAGIGALALLILLAQPFVGDWLGRGSATLLRADQFAACPWEER
jgi:hypothetical protein